MKSAIILLVLLVAYGSPAISAPPALGFYIVEDSPGTDLRYVDTKEFPKLGYIAKTPELTVTSLKAVYIGDPEPWKQYDSNHKLVESGESYSVKVTFQDADAKAFSALTGQAVNHKILIAVGDHYISAPMVNYQIPPGSIAISAPTKDELLAIKKELEQLVPK